MTAIGGFDTNVTATVQADNKLVLGSARDLDLTLRNWVISRYLPDGQRDATFGGDGFAEVSFGGGSSLNRVTDLLIEPDGRILGVGAIGLGDVGKTGTVARLTPSGDLDATFSGDGRTFVQHQVADTLIPGPVITVVDAEGRTVVVANGNRQDFGRGWVVSQLLLARINVDGTRDPGFADGTALHAPLLEAGFQTNLAVALDPSGAIFISGTVPTEDSAPSRSAGALLKLRPDGTLDASFGEAGLMRVPAIESILGLRALPDGRMLARVSQADGLGSGIARLLSDGGLDTTFGNGGFAESPASHPFLEDFGLAADGKIVAVRTEIIPLPAAFFETRQQVIRWFANGTLDRSFGVSGTLTLPVLDEVHEFVSQVTGIGDNKLVVLSRTGELAVRYRLLAEAGTVESVVDLFQTEPPGSGVL